MSILQIYLVGCVIGYSWARYIIYKAKPNKWFNVFMNFVAGGLSWISVIILIIVEILVYLEDNKPPKWL